MLARKLYHLGQTDPNARMTQRCAQGGFVKLTSTLLSRNVNVKVFTETPYIASNHRPLRGTLPACDGRPPPPVLVRERATTLREWQGPEDQRNEIGRSVPTIIRAFQVAVLVFRRYRSS
jgi:hypothetical protein